MIKSEKKTVWKKFQNIVNSQIHQVKLVSETSEKLQRLRKDLEKSNGNRSHLEFRLISYCSIRILQLCNYLWTQEETEMCSTEDKEAIKREVRDSLLNLELRLAKYTDEVIYRHFTENDIKFREEEARLFDTIEHTIRNNKKPEIDVESIKGNVNNVCERARDIGYNIGELTLSNDMSEILSILKLLSKSLSAENTRNLTENSRSGPNACFENQSVCPCEIQSSTTSEVEQGSGEIVDFSSEYTGSELSADWTTARTTALRIKNIPKLDLQFLDSEQEMEGVDRKYCEVSCWTSRTSSCVEEELCGLKGVKDYIRICETVNEKTDVSSVYESLSPRSIPSDVDSESRSSSTASFGSQTICRTGSRLNHPHCYGSFTLISRNQKTAGLDRQGSFTMDDLSDPDSNKINTSHSAGFESKTLFHRDNLSYRKLSTILSGTTQTIRRWTTSAPFYRNTISLIVILFLFLLRITWVYFNCNCLTRNILWKSFSLEFENISFLLDFFFSNMEIKHHGLQPV